MKINFGRRDTKWLPNYCGSLLLIAREMFEAWQCCGHEHTVPAGGSGLGGGTAGSEPLRDGAGLGC